MSVLLVIVFTFIDGSRCVDVLSDQSSLSDFNSSEPAFELDHLATFAAGGARKGRGGGGTLTCGVCWSVSVSVSVSVFVLQFIPMCVSIQYNSKTLLSRKTLH